MNQKISICIMAGGVGERFWPLSRISTPKQLINIVGQKALITETGERAFASVSPEDLYVVTVASQAEQIAAALPEMPRKNVIAEPYGRNTAPCIGLVSALLSASDPEQILAVIPADHCIPDAKLFATTIKDAAQLAASENALVTIGIEPRSPETGYGYIQAGQKLDSDTDTTFYKVDKFVEKPPLQKAQELLASGNAFWNAGMFVFKVKDMLKAFELHHPELYPALLNIASKANSAEEASAINDMYNSATSISIDYAIMEKARNVIVAKGTFTWDDVGSWTAAADHWPKDMSNNALRGEVLQIESNNCVIGNYAEGMVGVVGAKDLIVVRTKDAVMVCPRHKAQDVKKIVQKMKDNNNMDYVK